MLVSKLSTLLLDIVENKSCAAVNLWAIKESNTQPLSVFMALFHRYFQVVLLSPSSPCGVMEVCCYCRDPGILWGQQNPGIRNFHWLIQSQVSKLDMQKVKKKLIFCWWPGICKWWLNYGGLVPSQLITLESSLTNMFRRKLVRLTMFTMPSVMH